MNLSFDSTIQISILILNFSLAVYVFLKNSNRPVNLSFFVFVVGVCVWGGGLLFLSLTANFIFDKVSFFGGHFVFIGLFLIANTFPNSSKFEPKTWLFLMPWLVIFAITPFNVFVRETLVYPDGSLEPVLGPAFPFLVINALIYVIASLYLLFKKYFGLNGMAKLQMKYFLTGASVFIGGMLFFNAILPAFGIFTFNQIGPLFSIVFVGFTAYAIVRHELMDIRVVIQRGTIYTILAAMVAGLYIFGVFVLREFLGHKLEVSALISGLFAVLVGVFTVPPLEKYFRRITDKIFFKDKYDYPESLRHLSRITATGLDQISLIEQAVSSLKQIIKTEDVEVILDEPPQETPIVDGERGIRIGVLKLGPKLSGDKYDFEDIKLLQTFSYQLNVALEKTRLYEQVKDYSENLERKVDKRTAEIQRLQDEQRQMMIDISHGLQTPLTVIKGELDVYTKHAFSNRKRDLLARSVGDISNFVDQLLNLASLELKPGLKKEPVDISDLTQDLVEYFQTVARNKKINLLSNVQPGLIVLGQKDKLSEMIMNLVSNAFKYLNKTVHVKAGANGASVVEVGLRSKDGEVVLNVKDNGSGIDPADLPHIFERFYRAKKNNHHNGIPGSGLGLAICKKIVDLHDGRIEVKSRLGEGTTFTIHLSMNHP